MRKDNIQKGSYAEGLFLAKCLELGKNICIPITPTQFDAVVWDKVEFKRFQVKSVSQIDRSSRGEKVKCMLVTGRKGHRAYTKEDTDFVALWVDPTKDWYIFPIEEICGKMTISLFPTVSNSQSKYEKYRNAFYLI